MKSEIDQKEKIVNNLTLKVKAIEEGVLESSKVSLSAKEDALKIEKMGQEIKELKDKLTEAEAEKVQLKTDYEQMIAGLNDQIDKLKADITKRKSTVGGINNSMMDNDDVTILLVENENLKKKIKILENETSKQSAMQMNFKKNQEKETEIANLKEKIESLEKKLVG